MFPFNVKFLGRGDKKPEKQTSRDHNKCEQRLYILEKENEDLKINLKINKESLQAMLAELTKKESKETSLIETINIISQENASLKLKVHRLSKRLEAVSRVDQAIQAQASTAERSTSPLCL